MFLSHPPSTHNAGKTIPEIKDTHLQMSIVFKTRLNGDTSQDMQYIKITQKYFMIEQCNNNKSKRIFGHKQSHTVFDS